MFTLNGTTGEDSIRLSVSVETGEGGEPCNTGCRPFSRYSPPHTRVWRLGYRALYDYEFQSSLVPSVLPPQASTNRASQCINCLVFGLGRSCACVRFQADRNHQEAGHPCLGSFASLTKLSLVGGRCGRRLAAELAAEFGAGLALRERAHGLSQYPTVTWSIAVAASSCLAKMGRRSPCTPSPGLHLHSTVTASSSVF